MVNYLPPSTLVGLAARYVRIISKLDFGKFVSDKRDDDKRDDDKRDDDKEGAVSFDATRALLWTQLSRTQTR
jgi:hypothetical protein